MWAYFNPVSRFKFDTESFRRVFRRFPQPPITLRELRESLLCENLFHGFVGLRNYSTEFGNSRTSSFQFRQQAGQSTPKDQSFEIVLKIPWEPSHAVGGKILPPPNELTRRYCRLPPYRSEPKREN